MARLRVALSQLNAVVGDVEGNADRVLRAWREGADAGADLAVFPELVICGYPPEDLLLRPSFIRANRQTIERLTQEGPSGTAAIVGYVAAKASEADMTRDTTVAARANLRNAAAVIADGHVIGTYCKGRLPTYGIFDEARWFRPGETPLLFNMNRIPVGLVICEDLWTERGPVSAVAEHGASVVVVPNASPYERRKYGDREYWVRHHATQDGIWMVYVNLVGGQDGIVFYGDSVVYSPDGSVVARGAQFDEDLLVVDLDVEAGPVEGVPGSSGYRGEPPQLPDREEHRRLEPIGEVWQALVVGTRDYCRKNGFERAVVGLSGGIDSSTTACIAVDALGAENVLGVIMPSPFSSEESRQDAQQLAKNLGIDVEILSIGDLAGEFEGSLDHLFAATERGVTEENIQARVRGVLLMALSNKFGPIVLAPGNKSEYAAGYATLYGDMVGGLAPLMDVHKTLVYEIAHYRNNRDVVIPENVLTKSPSAELSPGQSDQDTLPPYETFDPIMCAYVEDHKDVEDIVSAGYERELVWEVIEMIDRAEYKRRQAAPGIKITHYAFGKDRRMPMTNAWRG
ncbi:MAG: NAD+ synthase [Nitriliruptorales bacterium]